MTLKIFAELVELKAKTASIFPFLMGFLYSWYHYNQIYWGNMLIFFISMVLFNMAVDIMDNYMDYHNATDVHDYKHETNIIGRENLSLSLVRNMMWGFIIVSALMGIYLASQTSWVILWLGMFSYAMGIFYSAGPKPLSSLPVGEVTSGLTMGVVIPLICVYLNIYDIVPFDWHLIGSVTMMSLPAAFSIANLMLANNTCDVEEDILNNRHTLVSYIGKKKAVTLFQLLVIATFVAATISVVFKIVPLTLLLLWAIFPKVWQNTKAYSKEQIKTKTFPLAIKNLAMVVAVQVVLFFIGALFHL
ncbi:prenyltransferase [Vagococcus fluvialis]|uniref:1,4-dihydroxy-2-naphthoate polyprenyltransferase n=2 Tax=Vagococcus fluvialis TaxID=2738 RepID=A0A369B0N5_9ENTE|nr:prenyltransferase [Vagococcus fluvialis]MBO0444524.1 prenyltransferase [Vagococcus fluvialis]RCX14983.1 1,4-dihydroxy-2-naphthoate octaprenyltransferase [Vagococcus fluvialis]RSU05727.1 1,4-dihydroxy-2-naphthoate polyprenyltransferase [Vagococcus fluvialis]UDM74657.1 prenyltransferase [Vagococcus fluvialis]WNF90133.1 prenyltransferase [Vagococcus fluvialis]